MSAAREAMLARVRAALDGAAGEVEVPRDYRAEAAGDVVALFAERSAEYRAQVVRVPENGLAAALGGLVSGTVAVPADLPDAWRPAGVELAVGVAGIDELDGADAVVTGCALAIAETGTLVLDGGPGQGIRAMTLIPDHHVCVVRAEQIVGTVPEAVRLLGAAVRAAGADHVRLGPVGDIRHRAVPGRGRPRPAAARHRHRGGLSARPDGSGRAAVCSRGRPSRPWPSCSRPPGRPSTRSRTRCPRRARRSASAPTRRCPPHGSCAS